MKRASPWDQSVIISCDSGSSDSEDDSTKPKNKNGAGEFDKDIMSEGALIAQAQMYHEYMMQIPIPINRGSVIPFTTWQGLARSLKQLYGQPLHYLTNILLKQWDKSRIEVDEEHQRLDDLIHPCKAEALIWLTEEVHRLTSSPHHIAKLWASDPMYHASIDPIFPQTSVTPHPF